MTSDPEPNESKPNESALEESAPIASTRHEADPGEAMPRRSPLAAACVLLVRAYQWTLSPIIGRSCRFQPTCSHYMIGAIDRYGAFRGVARGLARIARCHPWGGHGYDPP